eukprot:840708-Rhodomonas_salina.1
MGGEDLLEGRGELVEFGLELRHPPRLLADLRDPRGHAVSVEKQHPQLLADGHRGATQPVLRNKMSCPHRSEISV